MTEKIAWYYDFVSPYAYHQCHMLDRFGGRAEITAVPVLFAGLLNHWGQLGPAEMDTKRIWTYRFCQWYGDHHGVPFRMPPAHPFNPVNALRLMIVAASENGDSVGTARAGFDFVWGEGRNPSEPDEFLALAARLGVADAPAKVSDRAVKDALRRNTDEAVAAGVFGVPTLNIRGELFWGMDATDFALAYLDDPGVLDTPAMRQILTLPKAAERRR